MSKLVVLAKGTGNIAVNPDNVTHITPINESETNIFFTSNGTYNHTYVSLNFVTTVAALNGDLR